MNRLLSIFTSLILALWAGSLAHLVLTVSTLFAAFPKAESSVALQAAPQIFFVTERYHIALSVMAVVLIVAWRLVSCSRAKRGMMWLAVLATILAFVQTFGISSKMETLRQQGLSGGPEFTKYHHISTTQYMIQMGLVIASLALLPAAITSPDDRCKIKV